MTLQKKTIRCAIYTRKSTDENLEKEFNTLDAQREGCAAYIISQKSEGWEASPKQYDDGGFSGGSLERPALQQLLEDIKAGQINVIVVYKIDRLTRSLADFSKLVEIFDQYNVTFVSITQSFNTTTSMGRLTLNMLLSFAQFEREVTGERIRDKIAASKAKGMWMGGRPPLGYDIDNRRLVVNKKDSPQAKLIFEFYLKLGCVKKLKQEVDKLGIKSRRRTSVKKGHEYGGHFFSRGALYELLRNPVYTGKISHKGTLYEGLHPAIISVEIWKQVQAKLQDQATHSRGVKYQAHQNLLTGLMADEQGNPYTPVFTNKQNKKYRYYLNKHLDEDKHHPNMLVARLPAHEIEIVVEKGLRSNIACLVDESDLAIVDYIIQNSNAIPAYEIIRKCIKNIVVERNQLTLKLLPEYFEPLVKKYLNVSIAGHTNTVELKIPYQTKRAKHGAVVIQSKSRNKTVFDLPPEDLKILVQGVVWRDEHFAGSYISDIAEREGYSSRYVRNKIIKSFDTLSLYNN